MKEEINDAYAFDIETDGLVKPYPTAFTLAGDDDNVIVTLRTSDAVVTSPDSEADADPEKLRLRLEDAFEDTNISIDMVEVYDDWNDMAWGLDTIFRNVRDTEVLVTYNGLCYRGGFDIPALDWAFFQTGMDNPISGHKHTDVYDVVDRGYIYNTAPEFPSRGGPKKAEMQAAAEMFELSEEADGLNKSPLADLLNDHLTPAEMEQWAEEHDLGLPTNDVTTLDEVYEYIFADDILEDPFEDSSEAVDAWEEGDYDSLLIHNILDAVKTRRLYDYVEESSIPYKNYSPETLG